MSFYLWDTTKVKHGHRKVKRTLKFSHFKMNLPYDKSAVFS